MYLDRQIADDQESLLRVLPPSILETVHQLETVDGLLEIVMDLGRRPGARFPGTEIPLGDHEVTEADIDYVVERISEFGEDNRAGIERTLHRISAIRNRKGRVIGLTLRVGRAIFGTISIIQDLVESGKSLLLLGRPGVGKTTMLREVARVLADEFQKRVIIVDTSNEIAGDGDIPHPGIGHARRMQVASPSRQHAVMIEAVENHMPEVIVIDEIGTELEAVAARTIAERGVQLVGTAHGVSLENLMLNPTLSDLIGGIQSVTLSDEEARRRGTQKSILERKAPPTFDVIVEIQSWERVAAHLDVSATIDAILRGQSHPAQVRWMEEGEVKTAEGPARLVPTMDRNSPPIDPDWAAYQRRSGRGTRETSSWQNPPRRAERAQDAAPEPLVPVAIGPDEVLRPGQKMKIYPFGVSLNRLEQAISELRVPAEVTKNPREANAVMTLKTYYRRRPPSIREAEAAGTPVYVLKANTVIQMEQSLASIYQIDENADPITNAIQEAETAITQVLEKAEAIELAPQNAYVRRIQHQLAERYNLPSRSEGREPHRRVKIFP